MNLQSPFAAATIVQLHQAGNEVAWWERMKIKALDAANDLWEQTHPSTVQNP